MLRDLRAIEVVLAMTVALAIVIPPLGLGLALLVWWGISFAMPVKKLPVWKCRKCKMTIPRKELS